ncbi:hypothetical protein F0U44_16110 [Nocardioides humilatus]|uniref:Uncharacterized protein n=1 Tax=Nocardioides humilatus TaxID=2607660 RepID=A0A5B1LC43_9ACTN|nr:hypothetical protein [Nocardioides humilatus]KAA1417808.1 hypothetical protein F0U44_16110 [Nocardioides humilatus]
MLERELTKSDDHLEHDIQVILVSTGLRDWLVDVREGIVELTAPPGSGQRSIAALLARSVPGVVEVRVS